MTKQRNDNHSTEFGLWLRVQPEIDSKLGYIATNVDYIWKNYKNGKWMIIEEKRYNSVIKEWQRKIFQMLHSVCRFDKNYHGFHLLVFEKTGPDDGLIFLDNKTISKDELIKFLKFET